VADDGVSPAQGSAPQRDSPERLDELLQVVSPRSWISFAGLVVIVALGGAWSVWGRVPVVVEGRGVLIHPRLVVDVQSPLSGTLRTMELRAGQVVEKGDLLAEVDRPLLRHQLEQKQAELANRRARLAERSSLQERKLKLSQESLKRQRSTLARQIRELTEQADRMLAASRTSLDERRANLSEQLKLFRDVSERLQERVRRYEQLEKRGIVSKSDVLQLEQAAMNTLNGAQDMERRHKILDLETKLQDLDILESQRAQEASEFARETEEPIEALEREIAKLEAQLREETRILSPYRGRVLQVIAGEGQVIEGGGRLGVLEIEDPDAPLVSVTCFSIKDGKRVEAGMPLLVSPDSVERTRFGSVVGRVTEVGRFPVTSQEVTKIIGNEELARSLVPPEGSILVYGELERDPLLPLGYRWTSAGGPDLELTTGTTTSADVIVERRRPISFVFPILQAGGGS
jgi:HlyD family secretion protein